MLILQPKAEEGGSHFAMGWESQQFSLLTGGPRLQITSSVVWAPTVTSSPPNWWWNGGKINGFLSSETAISVMLGVWCNPHLLFLHYGKLKAEFEQTGRVESLKSI